MSTHRMVKEGSRKPPKRMLAAGRKFNGTWQVKTFLRPTNERETFWQSSSARSR